ncbi:hypothetical protein JL721_6754 [Aureococcus anophagefferens]|nr:hypothetical protein JL721_6754 [Aureococcus anophagefferens]
MSKPLEIPAIDDEDWNTGEIIEKVLSYSSSSRTHHRTHGDGHAQVLVPGDAPRANDAEIADAWAGKGAPADGAAPPRRSGRRRCPRPASRGPTTTTSGPPTTTRDQLGAMELQRTEIILKSCLM